MSRKNLYFLFFISILLMFSCKKEDQISIDNLTGTWTEVNENPNDVIESLIRYTFNPDKTCTKVIYNAFSNSESSNNWTYVISHDKSLITMYAEDKIYTEQYTITRLTNKEMQWKNASPGDGNSDKKLVRY